MYYGSKLSENMTETQEGFLLCKNVPIGRTGTQEYLGQEIGLEYGKRYEVIREEDEVFSDTAMASFEGKPFTDEHPPVEVTPENVGRYMKGIVHDVRRGQGDQSDLLLADIVVYDRRLIDRHYWQPCGSGPERPCRKQGGYSGCNIRKKERKADGRKK